MRLIRMAVVIAAASAAASKAKEYARANPDKASDTIGRVESFVTGKAGPKYADKVGKGSDALRSSLGLSGSTTGGGTSSAPSYPVDGPEPTVPPGGFDTSSPPSDPVDGPAPTDPPRGFDPSI
jgi:hypothetical protein